MISIVLEINTMSGIMFVTAFLKLQNTDGFNIDKDYNIT